MLSFLACLIGVFAPVSVTYSDIVTIQDRQIRVIDVVDLEGMDSDVKDKVSHKVIATIPSNQSSVTFSRHSLASLIRQRIPGLPLTDHEKADELVHIKYSKTETRANNQKCFTFTRPVIKGQAIIAEDLTGVGCNPAKSLAPMKYNSATGVLRASTNIEVGRYAGRVLVPSGKFPDTDDELVLRVAIGPVQIEKTVWALQPANDASRIFVKDRQGNVLRVPIQPSASKEGIND